VSSEAILSLREVSKSFGGLKALDTVSFDLDRGQITSLVGPNGSGKTTLFNCISGIYTPESGRIHFSGREVTSYSAARRCKMGIGRTFQVVRPFLKMTCFENILVGWCFGQEKYQKPAASDADGILEFVGLKDRKHHQAGELRLAERKRLEIARALATQPKLLLLDEVAAGLNPVEVQGMVALLRQIHLQGITLLIVEHVMSLVMDISDRVIVLNEGKKLADDQPEYVSNNQKVIEVYLGPSELDPKDTA